MSLHQLHYAIVSKLCLLLYYLLNFPFHTAKNNVHIYTQNNTLLMVVHHYSLIVVTRADMLTCQTTSVEHLLLYCQHLHYVLPIHWNLLSILFQNFSFCFQRLVLLLVLLKVFYWSLLHSAVSGQNLKMPS